MNRLFLILVLLAAQVSALIHQMPTISSSRSTFQVSRAEKDEETIISPERSLEQKMADWEPTEEERKAATLGGLIPGSTGADGFDIGLYVAFPFLFGSLFLFLVFPFLRDSLDIGSLEPPPTQ